MRYITASQGTTTTDRWIPWADANLRIMSDLVATSRRIKTRELVALLRETFVPSWHDIHGASHWARVRLNAMRICSSGNGANAHVCELFALLHDSQRLDDGECPGHGARAASFIATLNGKYFDCTTRELDQLMEACSLHSDGFLSDCPTIGTCWDADRLDLGRVDITPDARYMSTEEGRQLASRLHGFSLDDDEDAQRPVTDRRTPARVRGLGRY